MFCGYAFGYRRLTPLFSVHSFRKVSRPVEGHVWVFRLGRGSFSNAARALSRGRNTCGVRTSTATRIADRMRGERRPHAAAGSSAGPHPQPDAADLPEVESGSVDLILTDPPYFDNLSYFELS